MTYTLELDDDTISEITRQSLEESVIHKAEDVKANNYDNDEELQTLLFLLGSLHYYSTKEQYESFCAKHQVLDIVRDLEKEIKSAEKQSMNVTTEENDDGSLTINLDANDEMINRLASNGLEYSIIKGILNTQDASDILMWAERGKKEFATDAALGGFGG